MKHTQTAIQRQWLSKILHPKHGYKNLYTLVCNLFGKKLYNYQVKTLRDLLDPNIDKVLMSYARQGGKSEVLAVFQALVPILFNDINVYVFGPKQDQARLSFDRATGMIKTNKWNLFEGNIIVDRADKMKFTNRTQLGAESASLNAEIEGLTMHVGILDECQNISSYKIKEAILPMGSATRSKIVLSGVPKVCGTYFHDAWRDPTYIKHIYPWKQCLSPKGNLDKKYVLERKEEDPEIFATQYELKWVSDSSIFLSSERWHACEMEYSLEEEKGDFWGVDFAKRRDSTVITEGKYDPKTEEIKIVNWWELKGTKYNEQVGFMKDIYHNGIQVILCDKTAVGDPIIDFMTEAGLPAQGFNFDIHHKDKLYKFLRAQISRKKVHWPKKSCYTTTRQQVAYKRFMQQCIDLEISYKSSGLMNVHHPDISNACDDFPDSLALLVYASQEYISPSGTFW